MKKTTIHKIALVSAIATFVLSSLTVIALFGARLLVISEYNAAYEIQYQQSLSPSGAEHTAEQLNNIVKQEFANRHWLFQVASGNVQTSLIIFLMVLLLLALICSSSYVFIYLDTSKKEKAAKKAIRAKRAADARAFEKFCVENQIGKSWPL